MLLLLRVIIVSFLLGRCITRGQSTQASSNDSQTSSDPTLQTTTVQQTTEEIVTLGLATTPSQLDETTDLGPCVCDVTMNGCDVNCCCDEDCTEADKDTFSECLDQKYMTDDRVCVQDTLVFKSNTPDYTTVRDSSLFCVTRDNYAERNYYSIPDPVTSISSFNELSSQYKEYSYEMPSDTDAMYGDYYKSGDAIYTVYETLSLGVLGLPKQLTTGACVDTNPSAFLFDASISCVREVADIAEMCESLPQLSAISFTDGFKIVSSPAFLKDNPPPKQSDVNQSTTATTVSGADDNTTEATTMFDATTTIDIEYYDSEELIWLDIVQPICRSLADVDCEFLDLPSPAYNESTATCTNVLQELRYTITHNATEGIVAASVQAVLSDITSDQHSIVQTSQIIFEKSGQIEEPFRRSGSPGYIVGQPLMAGTRIELEEGTKLAIALRDDRDNWLTVIRSTADGSCLADTDSRIPVTFGEDIRTGCIVSITLGNSTDACELIQAQILNALKGSLPDEYYVAMFGDSSTEVVGDWVPILQESIAGAPSSPTVGTCSNMVTGLHIEVIYSNVGSLQNPQPKVLGVKYSYADGKTLRYQCLGSSCQDEASSPTQRFEISSSVMFIDGSIQPEPVVAERPSWESKLPNDFFYPFTGTSRSSAVVVSSFLGSVLVAATIAVNSVT